jgi:two-component system, OmpR family, osmolarity sensor histidine kinase EnvZ
MRLLPGTLFGRTALLMVLLIAVTELATLSIIRHIYIDTFRSALIKEIAANISLVQTTLRAVPAGQRAAFLKQVPIDGGRVVPNELVATTLDYSQQRRGLAEAVKAALGQPVTVGSDPVGGDIWVGFKVDDASYWLILPYKRFSAYFPYGPLAGIALLIVASMAGAYLVIFGLSRQLRDVLKAARALGRGENPEPVAEVGPQEVRELSRGFNQMAEGLRRLDAERRLMLAGISHDVRSPLARVRLGVEILAEQRDPVIVNNMIQDIEEMDAIITQFLDYARDGREEQPQDGDLNQVVLDVCARYEASGTKIGMDLDPLPALRFRRLAMRRLIANLLDNAVRYGGKSVQLTTRQLSGKVVITVADRGPGIQDVEPASLIRPFARGNPSRGDQYGAGLGLTIADRIARLHGGELSLSNREGGGLQVAVEIPVS